MSIVVLLDGDPLQARLIADNLSTVGHTVLWVRHGLEGLVLIHRVRPDLVLADIAVPDCFEVLTLLRALRGLEQTPLLLLASCGPPQYRQQKLAIGGWINKHLDADELIQQVQRILVPPPLRLP